MPFVSSILEHRAGAEKRYRRHLVGPQQMTSGQMTSGAAISMARQIVLALILLLAWPTHGAPRSRRFGTDDVAGMVDPRVSQANIQVTISRRGWTRPARSPQI